ncbi:transposase [Acinetobacter sp. SH024]|uniref:Putative transposae n=1 Tax=Acinetobacter pittii TaxID=48296 RepID=A0A075M998_ACIPI|nr:Putative transposae [Acinetobacter pittii]EFF84693.1 transposase [Acinetobacter sp. SH024]CAM84757.1 putative HTH-type transcriptional regulator, transposon related ORF [Acinetobacter baumannii AYE]
MLMSSKRYPEEFKIEAVKQVTEKGHSVAEVAARLGTTTHSMYAWIKRYDPQQPKITESNDPRAELAKLKKELQRVTEERDILKKAVVYFASQSK